MTHRCITVTIITMTLLLNACEGAESESTLDESHSFDLRGGATLTLTEGTEFDADELESREGYGTTLTDTSGTKWFVNVEEVDAPTLDQLGVTAFPSGEGVGYLGMTWGDGEDGDQCLVFLPIEDESFVLMSRLHDGVDCPESIDEIADWLPSVEANGEDGFLRAFGDVVGSFNGITAYSNGSVPYNSYQFSTVGRKWQSPEYVNRYFYQKLAHRNLIGAGNANQYFGSAANLDLVPYTNGVSTTRPAVGDMLATNGGVSGHVALIREVGVNYVKVIHQNWANSPSDSSMTLSMSVANGKYTVSSFPGNYPVQGWLRRKPVCMPTINSVTPTTATLNQSKQFTATGSCLSASTTAPWISECTNFVVNSRTSTSLVFTCTPSYSTGVKSGVIKHNTDGTVLRNFSVTVY